MAERGEGIGAAARGKRIAFINTDAMSFNNLMRGQLEYLCSLGAEIDLYCGGPREDLEVLVQRHVGHVRHLPFRRPPNPFWDLVCLIWLTILLASKRYDTVVYSTPKALLIGALAALLTFQRRRIAWFRGRAYEAMSGLKRRFFVAFDRITIACSHQVLFVSPSLLEAFRRDGLGPGGKATILGHGSSNGVDLDRFRPAAPKGRLRARAELGLTAEDFVIVAVGRVAPDKGIAQLLELADRLRDVANLRLLFVGSIEDRRLGERISAPSDPRIRWHPPTRQAETFFQAADLHLLLSCREGLPNVALEAAAAGVPTIAWDVVGVRDAVIPGVSGILLPFGDMAALQRTVRGASADPSAFAQRFAGARQLVGDRFAQRDVWRNHARLFLGCEELGASPTVPAER